MIEDIHVDPPVEVPLVFIGRLEERDILSMQWYMNLVIWRYLFWCFAALVVVGVIFGIVIGKEEGRLQAIVITISISLLAPQYSVRTVVLG